MRILKAVSLYTSGLVFSIVGALGLWIILLDAIRVLKDFKIELSPFNIPIWFDVGHPQNIYYVRLVEDSAYYGLSASIALVTIGVGLMVFGLRKAIIASPRATVVGLIASYKAVIRYRNWVLEKVEYLQSESGKWRATFNILKAPYSLLRYFGLSPRMAAGLLLASSTVGTSVVASETVFADRSFARGDAGVYSAPSDIPIFYEDGNNTLRVDLGTTPIGEIRIEDITVGTAYANSVLPSGESNVIIVGGIASVGTYLEVGHLIIDRWRCTQLKIQNTEAHTLNITKNASDGQSIAPVAGVPRARGIGGGNRADNMTTSGGYYDQIKITAPTQNVNGKVDVLALENLYTKGGPCIIDRVKAGQIDIRYSEVGAGDGFDDKDFVVATSTIYKVANIEENVEVAISPP